MSTSQGKSTGMTFYLVVYFLNEEEKKPFAVVPNTSIAVGTNRCEPIKSYVGKVVDFLWGTGKVKENYPARILYTHEKKKACDKWHDDLTPEERLKLKKQAKEYRKKLQPSPRKKISKNKEIKDNITSTLTALSKKRAAEEPPAGPSAKMRVTDSKEGSTKTGRIDKAAETQVVKSEATEGPSKLDKTTPAAKSSSSSSQSKKPKKKNTTPPPSYMSDDAEVESIDESEKEWEIKESDVSASSENDSDDAEAETECLETPVQSGSASQKRDKSPTKLSLRRHLKDKKPTSTSEPDLEAKIRRETISSEDVEDFKGYGSPDEEVDPENLVKNIVTHLVRHVEILKAKIRLARLNRSSTAYLEEQLMVAKARLTAGQTANKTSSSSEKDVIASSVKEGGSSNKYYGSSSQSAVQKLSTTKTKNEDDDVFTQSRPGSFSQSAVQKPSTSKTKNDYGDVFTQSRPGSSSPSAVQKPSTSKMKHEYGDVLTQSRPGSSAQSVFGKSSSSKNKENSVNVMRKTLKEYFGPSSQGGKQSSSSIRKGEDSASAGSILKEGSNHHHGQLSRAKSLSLTKIDKAYKTKDSHNRSSSNDRSFQRDTSASSLLSNRDRQRLRSISFSCDEGEGRDDRDSDEESDTDSFASILEQVKAPIDASSSVLVATCYKKNEIIESLITVVKEKNKEIKELRQKVDKLQLCESQLVPIYPGAPLKMQPVVLTYITSEKRVGSILRNFLRFFYTEAELKGSSVSGKECHANKESDAEPLPRLEPVRYNAILEFMLRREGLGQADVEKNRSLSVSANACYARLKKKTGDFLWAVRHGKAETKFDEHSRRKSN